MNTQERTLLSEADHEQFIRDGYVLLRGVVPEDVLAPAREYFEAKGMKKPDYAAEDSPLAQACITGAVHDAVAELFGPDLDFPRSTSAGYMPRGREPEAAAGFHGGHIDADYACLQPDIFAVWAWVFLTTVRPGGGAIGLAKGSQRSVRSLLLQGYRATLMGFDGKWGGQPVDFTEYAKVASGGLPVGWDIEEICVDAGDVLIYHHHVGHSGSSNVTDDQTRHALQLSFAPHTRIAPGLKPIEELSTIEKANSTQYLHTHFGEPMPAWNLPVAESWTSNVRSHGIIRHAGHIERFVLDDADPTVARHVHTGTEIPLGGLARAITVVQHMVAGVILTATMEDGTAIVLKSIDLENWTPIGSVSGVTAAHSFALDYAAGDARGNNVFFAPVEDPTRIDRLTAPQSAGVAKYVPWDDVTSWDRGTFAHAPAPAPVRDIFLEPTSGAGPFALVVETEDGIVIDEQNEAGTFKDLRPLVCDVAGAVRCIRLFERARRYWLVSYLRDDAWRWGVIDFEVDATALRELQTTEQIEEALAMVGLL